MMTAEQALQNLDKAWRMGRFTDAENQALRESVAVLAQAIRPKAKKKPEVADGGQVEK